MLVLFLSQSLHAEEADSTVICLLETTTTNFYSYIWPFLLISATTGKT